MASINCKRLHMLTDDAEESDKRLLREVLQGQGVEAMFGEQIPYSG